ncbi:MAG: C-terminal binding protein [Eubacteriales bacterium]|nr:C-terminal binding protein [Eubacteriales bacterium]
MKIIIAEYPESADRSLDIERAVFPEDAVLEVAVYTEEREEEFIRQCRDADAILVGYVAITGKIIDGLERCRVISIQSTGYNYVDVDHAREKGIAVCAIGEYCTQEVADHAVMLMLALLRGLKIYDRSVQKDREWIYDAKPGLPRIQGLRLGIAGYGKIGKAVARRAMSFGMEILAYDPYIPAEDIEKTGARAATWEELLEQSDVITNHMNLTEENKGMFCMEAFRKMKRSPILLNVARGGSIIEADLAEALDQGLIAGAGLDVLASETPDLSDCPLMGRENVILTPHCAFYSQETERLLYEIPAKNVLCCLAGEHKAANRVVNRVGLED